MHIYKFTHIETGRCYIGQTIQEPNQRRLEHISGSRHTDRTYHFHNALRKYGVSAFTFEVIDTVKSLEELNLLEERYVEKFDSINNGFNIRQAGGNKLHSEESKQRMSIAQKEAHARRRELNKGVEKHSTPRRHKGKTGLWNISEEAKNKISIANKGRHAGMSWEEIYGPKNAKARRESRKLKALSRKLGG
jgi:group I intron endonuclease